MDNTYQLYSKQTQSRSYYGKGESFTGEEMHELIIGEQTCEYNEQHKVLDGCFVKKTIQYIFKTAYASQNTAEWMTMNC